MLGRIRGRFGRNWRLFDRGRGLFGRNRRLNGRIRGLRAGGLSPQSQGGKPSARPHCRAPLLAGRGPDEKEIDKKIADMHIGHFVRRIGHQTDLNVLDGLYQRAALFVFPSLYDNAPMVVREAAVMGTHAVLVRGSSAAEIIDHGINGFLCENSPEDLCRTFQSALDNPDACAQIGQKAKETIPVPWETIMETVVERYERLIALGREGKLTKKYLRVI